MKLSIKEPCLVDWKAMKGDEKKRFCGQCNTHVHNLSEMTETEARETLCGLDSPCVRYDMNDDDSVRFKPSKAPAWFLLAAAMTASACQKHAGEVVSMIADLPTSQPVEVAVETKAKPRTLAEDSKTDEDKTQRDTSKTDVSPKPTRAVMGKMIRPKNQRNTMGRPMIQALKTPVKQDESK